MADELVFTKEELEILKQMVNSSTFSASVAEVIVSLKAKLASKEDTKE